MPVAQLVRAPSLYLGGPWFKSRQAHTEAYSFPKERMPYVYIYLGGPWFESKKAHRMEERTASAVHDAWLARNHAHASEIERLPYSQLPEEEKEKDRMLVRALVKVAE